MDLELFRTNLEQDYTLGEIRIDSVFECFTLEDPIRETKIQDDTAIPAGRYEIILNKSPKFGRIMPRLLDVPNFTGILIHKGNTKADTRGCILVGAGVDFDNNRLVHSTQAFEGLMTKLAMAVADGQQIHITIHNPEAQA